MENFDDIFDNSSPGERQGGQQYSKDEYAAMKKGEREELYAWLDATAMSAAAEPAAFRQYLDVQSRFDRYSAVNALLVLSQKPNAERLGDLAYWRKQKVFIQKDEINDPIRILEPGDQYQREDGSIGTYFNIKYVYDISQAERKILPPAPPKYTERQIIQALISKYPQKIMLVDELPDDRGAMTNQDGEILVRKSMAFSDTFRSVAYEMACLELTGGTELSPEQEFSVYSATYMLCKKYGAETGAFNFDNVGGVFAGMDAQEVKGELSLIRDAADGISKRMEQNLDAIQKAAKAQEAR